MPFTAQNTLIVRSHYGDESVALVQYLHEIHALGNLFNKIIVVYIDTGWAAKSWSERISLGEDHVHRCGFESLHLVAPASFDTLVRERNNFPCAKFQWCANFLKGLPLLSWLDEHDPAAEWTIAIAKRQALYRQSVPEYIEQCEYHGERTVWHPLLMLSCEQRNVLLAKAGFSPLQHRSLECEPCVNSHANDLNHMAAPDQDKLQHLEQHIGKRLFSVVRQPTADRQSFSMGCGDFFGCGL